MIKQVYAAWIGYELITAGGTKTQEIAYGTKTYRGFTFMSSPSLGIPQAANGYRKSGELNAGIGGGGNAQSVYGARPDVNPTTKSKANANPKHS